MYDNWDARKLAVPLLEPTQPSWLCENQLRPLERQLRQLKKKACLEDSDDDELNEAITRPDTQTCPP